ALAETLGLSHTFLDTPRASEAQLQAWDRAVGHAVRESNRETHPALDQLPNGYIMTGLYGENGRSRMYASDFMTINDKPASVDMVVGRLGLPKAPEVMQAVEEWLSGIAWLPTSCILDLAFHEIKFGTWAMAQVPAQHAIPASHSSTACMTSGALGRPSRPTTISTLAGLSLMVMKSDAYIRLRPFSPYRPVMMKALGS
ncbi:MAG: hypothetical protein AAFQ34_16270, partial [Pseudomonadota bacterium]